MKLEYFRILLAGFFILSSRALAGGAAGGDSFDYSKFLKSVQVSSDFTIELTAGEPNIRFPMFACFDEAGRLFVAESSGEDLYAGLKKLSRDCRISRLEDADGDGRFETSLVFQETLTFPMGLAWHEGRLYVADPPDLIALTDTDGDGRADRREVLLSGFGHTDNGSLHGLTFGPDGRLYFTMGEPDGWKLPRGDGSFLEGVAGALFRCRPDGSQPEVICRGFENLVEIEFMPGGEIIGTDNWYQRPAAGLRDALIDCAPGGLYPYAADRGTPLPRTGITLPPLTLLPAVAHSGLTRLRAAGFPAEWKNSLFVAEHNTRKVVRHELRREGSTFAATNVDFVVSEHPDFHPSDVLEDADGSLLIIDTGGWYVQHCPTGRIRDSRAPGGVYRIRWNQAPKHNDPRGRTLNWKGEHSEEVAKRLRDSRVVVAERAAAELRERREIELLSRVLFGDESLDVRLRALWALARIADGRALAALRAQFDLNENASPLRLAAARALAFRGDRLAGDSFVRALDSTNAPIRRAAAEALAVCGSRAHAPRLVTALANAADDFVEHACVVALLALADEPFVRALLEHPSPRVRQAALNLLDQPPFGTLRFLDLLAPLGNENPMLQATARRLLERHADWAAEALPWLREQLTKPNPPALVGLFTAFQSDPEARQLISKFLDPAAAGSLATRALLLDILPSLTSKPPEADWLRAIPRALTNATLRLPALRAAVAFPEPRNESLLVGLANNEKVPIGERLLAARASAPHPLLSTRVFDLALAALKAHAEASDRMGAIELLARARLSVSQFRQLLDTLQAGPTAPLEALIPTLIRGASAETRPPLASFFAACLRSGWSPNRAILDRALAAFADDPPLRESLVAAWQQNLLASRQRLNEFRPLLSGGNVERGRHNFLLATCDGCHRIGERGGTVGPDLTKIGAIRSPDDLLESILFPSSTFAQGYEPYSLTRKDGEEISGSLVSKGAEAVSLRDGTGLIHHVRPDDIASLVRQESSAMPTGLEQLLTREQFQDLLAYLQSLK